MLGWEFPPFISGGLGTACYGLTSHERWAWMCFVLPRPVDTSHATRQDAYPKTDRWRERTGVRLRRTPACVFSPSSPCFPVYGSTAVSTADGGSHPNQADDSSTQCRRSQQRAFGTEHYSGDMFAGCIATPMRPSNSPWKKTSTWSMHDWMTYPAGIAVAAVTGRPLVVHVHSTEFDRSGEHVNQMIYDIERRGTHAAAKVIAVSHLTRVSF